MADLFYTIFIIWNYLWILGVFCLLLRSDYKEIIIEIFSTIIQKNIFLILVSGLIIYVFIPLTIPYSFKSIINKNEEDKNEED
jgi:hypothetical protein